MRAFLTLETTIRDGARHPYCVENICCTTESSRGRWLARFVRLLEELNEELGLKGDDAIDADDHKFGPGIGPSGAIRQWSPEDAVRDIKEAYVRFVVLPRAA